MSDGYRNGAFALGVITGLGLALNLFLWLDYQTQHEGNEDTQEDRGDQYSEIGGWWDWFLGTFVSPSDTLAQWIMTIFTVAAVILVWRTLIATQEMARDARDIGEAQTTSYLVVEHVFTSPKDVLVNVRWRVKNMGTTPALNVKMSIRIQPYGVAYGKGVEPLSQSIVSDLEAIAGGSAHEGFRMFLADHDPNFFNLWPPKGSVAIFAIVELTWMDVFNKWHYCWFRMSNPDEEVREQYKEYNINKMFVTRSRFEKLSKPPKETTNA